MARPLAVNRHDRIRERIEITGSATVGELASELGVSRETIRRDLKLLADRRELDVVHGGATRRLGVEPSLAQRQADNTAGKAAIARAAAALVEDDMVVLLDSGTTALLVAEALTSKSRLTVITNGLANALLLARVPSFRVIVLGGEIDAADEGSVGIDTMDMLRNYRVDIAFVAAGGLAADGQPTDFSRLWAEQRQRMIAVAKRAYFMVDSSKFERQTPVRITGVDNATGIIVDIAPSRQLSQAVSDRGFDMLVA
ncbi:DeoR/GlpR family DNA-binding transcription regulator [Phreatobacter stygius]|uniref:DeoR/GlpR transcriptional regulator n=1 Tax=Phreatobacter stygius TaxID=1940610 RepID=A0A4D7B691_9HYPH|nr:DeoR/GlpR family DNA-binding transcription regulator [Phreatobacter stygius]QCI65700.1 DeoR/GlpR transcriptional regulator [Phreatobacter stygius]